MSIQVRAAISIYSHRQTLPVSIGDQREAACDFMVDHQPCGSGHFCVLWIWPCRRARRRLGHQPAAFRDATGGRNQQGMCRARRGWLERDAAKGAHTPIAWITPFILRGCWLGWVIIIKLAVLCCARLRWARLRSAGLGYAGINLFLFLLFGGW